MNEKLTKKELMNIVEICTLLVMFILIFAAVLAISATNTLLIFAFLCVAGIILICMFGFIKDYVNNKTE